MQRKFSPPPTFEIVAPSLNCITLYHIKLRDVYYVLLCTCTCLYLLVPVCTYLCIFATIYIYLNLFVHTPICSIYYFVQ